VPVPGLDLVTDVPGWSPHPVPVPGLDVVTDLPPLTRPGPATRADRQGRAHAKRMGRRREVLITASTWVRNIGALLILFAVWQLWGTAITQHHSQDALKQQFSARVHAHAVTAGFSLVPATTPWSSPPDGIPIAVIDIPKINVSQVVVSGTNESDLSKGPGHYSGTAMPGQAGNIAIAGHRTTHGAPFNGLANLAPGDPIYLTDIYGHRMTYVVALTPYPVQPSNVSVLNYFGDNRLTLTTCNPEFSARQRLVVAAEYQPPVGARPAHPVALTNAGRPYRVTISGEAGWNTSLFPQVFAVVGLLLALGLTNRRWSRMLGRESRWLVLVPIWTALLVTLFQLLTNFLPAAA
jgi:sortase A